MRSYKTLPGAPVLCRVGHQTDASGAVSMLGKIRSTDLTQSLRRNLMNPLDGGSRTHGGVARRMVSVTLTIFRSGSLPSPSLTATSAPGASWEGFKRHMLNIPLSHCFGGWAAWLSLRLPGIFLYSASVAISQWQARRDNLSQPLSSSLLSLMLCLSHLIQVS